MAGIGFELKKLFGSKGYIKNIRAYFYTAVITVGPTILCMTMVVSINLFLIFTGVDLRQRELFLAAVTYSFIFSQIITSGFSMVVTRYISDKIFNKEYDEILPSLYGIITVCLIIGGIMGGIFYYFSPLRFIFKLSAYMLYMELIISWLLSVYLSALRDYMKIVKSFLCGVIVTLTFSYIFIKFSDIESALCCIIAMDIGVFLIVVLLILEIKKFFVSKSKGYFRFMIYIGKYPALFFIGMFYTIGLYVHNFVFWFSSFGVTAGDTYIFCPFYDVPTFYAMLTIITAMVIFVASVETSFYEKYRDYYSAVLGEGTLDDITRSKEEMRKVLVHEITYTMELQLFFSIVFMVIGMRLLPRIGLIGAAVDIFNILVLGSYSCVIMFIITLILLYFDDRKGAVFVSGMFLVTNTIFTSLSLILGENLYGFGFFVSSFIMLIVAIIRLILFLKDIDYYTFCSQPVVYKENKSLIEHIVIKLEAFLQ